VRLRGIIPPLTTPFETGAVSGARLRENVERYRQAGVHGFLVLGSSGEAPLLDEDEKIELLRAAREAIPGELPLLAGTGLESTAATIRLCHVAADCGADAALVVTPHYYAARMDEQALRRHYLEVADASTLPLLLYDVPKFTHVQIPSALVAALARHDNIIGIKDSGGNLERLAGLVAAVPADFAVICGSHRIFAAALRAGVRAGILAAANPLPEAWVALSGLVEAGRDGEAQRLQDDVAELADLAVSRLGVAGIKAAMDLRGMYGGSPRPPLLPLQAAERSGLERTLRRAEATVSAYEVPPVPRSDG
jgi:4-hydroxy-2-oxoglutarate aldolase